MLKSLTNQEVKERVGNNSFFVDDFGISAKLEYKSGIPNLDLYLNGKTIKQIDAELQIIKYPRGIVIKIAKLFSSIKYAIDYRDIINVKISQEKEILLFTIYTTQEPIVFSIYDEEYIIDAKIFLNRTPIKYEIEIPDDVSEINAPPQSSNDLTYSYNSNYSIRHLNKTSKDLIKEYNSIKLREIVEKQKSSYSRSFINGATDELIKRGETYKVDAKLDHEFRLMSDTDLKRLVEKEAFNFHLEYIEAARKEYSKRNFIFPEDDEEKHNNVQIIPNRHSSNNLDNSITAEPPKTYMVQAILVTLFCFFPFGIVTIVYASKVERFIDIGDIDRANIYSRKAEDWMFASFFTGIAIFVIYLLIIISV